VFRVLVLQRKISVREMKSEMKNEREMKCVSQTREGTIFFLIINNYI
jgi:hypothetical protein